MKLLKVSLLIVLTAVSTFAADTKKAADYLQDVSVTIRSEGRFSIGEGSGVIFSRQNKGGDTVNFVWTAAHVVDNLRVERKIIVKGTPHTVVEFKDAKIVKVIRQNGRTVGRLELDAEVIKYSNSQTGHDLALLKVRKLNFHDFDAPLPRNWMFYYPEPTQDVNFGALGPPKSEKRR